MTDKTRRQILCVLHASVLTMLAPPALCLGQITTNEGDGILNAPYRGPIESLRQRHEGLGFGEVMPHVEPSSNLQIEGHIRVWCPSAGGWNRAILRLFNGLDASDDEIDLRGHVDYESAYFLPIAMQPFSRFTFKAIGAHSLAPEEFEVIFHYRAVGENGVAITHEYSRRIRVGPIESSDAGGVNLEEAYLRGTKLLSVTEGNVRVDVPIGRTANMIGAAFFECDRQLGPSNAIGIVASSMTQRDVVLPWASESVFIPHDFQFRLGGTPSGPYKSNYGTPCAAHMPGYHFLFDLFGPSGWAYQTATTIDDGAVRFESYTPIRELDSGSAEIADGATVFTYEQASHQYDTDIQSIIDSDGNIVSLGRLGGDVDNIKVLVGADIKHDWEITSAPTSGWIAAAIVHDGDNGPIIEGHRFDYEEMLDEESSLYGRCSQIRDLDNQILYKFDYYPATHASVPGDLNIVWRFDENTGAFRKVVEYFPCNENGTPNPTGYHRAARSYHGVGTNDYVQTVLKYEMGSRNGTRLTQILRAEQTGDSNGPWRTTTFEYYNHNNQYVDVPYSLPKRILYSDGRSVDLEYDEHTDTDIVSGAAIPLGNVSRISAGGVTLREASYDYLYDFDQSSSIKRLYYQPRLVELSDGGGEATKVRIDFESGGVDENGDGVPGELSNDLLAWIGPIVNSGPSEVGVQHVPHQTTTVFDYESSDDVRAQISRVRLGMGTADELSIELGHDLLRRTASLTLVNGEEQAKVVDRTCDRIGKHVHVDADGYVTETWFNANKSPEFIFRFLNPIAVPATDDWQVCDLLENGSAPWRAAGNTHIKTSFLYDQQGRITEVVVENKDSEGLPLTPAVRRQRNDHDSSGISVTAQIDGGNGTPIDASYTEIRYPGGGPYRLYDRYGRGSISFVEPTGQTNAWALINRPIISGTGTPPGPSEALDALDYKTTYDINGHVTREEYVTLGNLRPTLTYSYDEAYRLKTITASPGVDAVQGNVIMPGEYNCRGTIVTEYKYNNSSNVNRVTTLENNIRIHDQLIRYDEANRPYEIRTRTQADASTNPLSSDRVRFIQYNALGQPVAEKYIGDSTGTSLLISYAYDTFGRIVRVTDSEGGEASYEDYDKRGNVRTFRKRLSANEWAQWDYEYDAFSRPVMIRLPHDAVGDRAFVRFRYDAFGNVVRITQYDGDNNAILTRLASYDSADRLLRVAVMNNPNQADSVQASNANPAVDRVVDFTYDANGSYVDSHYYLNNSGAPVTERTTLDAHGRVLSTSNAAGVVATYGYAVNNGAIETGRIQRITVDSGNPSGAAITEFDYDGHDRLIRTRLLGQGSTGGRVVTQILDGLGQTRLSKDPRGIITQYTYSVAGDLTSVIENLGGSPSRTTLFDYDRLGHMKARSTINDNQHSPTNIQTTHYRYNSVGRILAVAFPDTDINDINDSGCANTSPNNCVDAVRMSYDFGGRPVAMRDQRGIQSSFKFDRSGLLMTRDTVINGNSVRDTFRFDSLGRLELADRGTPANQSAVSHAAFAYTSKGDLDYEVMSIGRAGHVNHAVNYGYDQAGILRSLDYASPIVDPTGVTLDFIPTASGVTDKLLLTYPGHSDQEIVDYDYAGGKDALLSRRVVSSPDVGAAFAMSQGFDHHDNVDSLSYSLDGSIYYGCEFLLDLNGNVEAEFPVGGPFSGFLTRERIFAIDDLGRITATEYGPDGQSRYETTTYDALGNRVSYKARDRNNSREYRLANPANEFGQVGGSYLQYDEAGNLSVDANGRRYQYNEDNQLVKVLAPDGIQILGKFEYDALGRRIYSSAGAETVYYYSGHRILEERNATDNALIRYHLYGGQHIDERIATYDQSSDAFRFYIPDRSLSPLAIANSDGSVISPVDMTIWGAFDGSSVRHDANEDGDIDQMDALNFLDCFAVPDVDCVGFHDANGDLVLDATDVASLAHCMAGPGVPPPADCIEDTAAVTGTADGDVGLHGMAVVRLADGKILLDARSRLYDPELGRFLQRDSAGYVDGSNLYESFMGNPLAYSDPWGTSNYLLTGGMPFVRTPNQVAVGSHGFFLDTAIEFGKRLAHIPSDTWTFAKQSVAGTSPLQQQARNYIDTEFNLGGTASENWVEIAARATANGFNALDGGFGMAAGVTGEQVLFTEYGNAITQKYSALERGEQFFAGLSQNLFLWSAGARIASTGYRPLQLPVLSPGQLSAVSRLIPKTPGGRTLALRLALSNGVRQFGRETPGRLPGLAFETWRAGESVVRSVSEHGAIAEAASSPSIAHAVTSPRLFPNLGGVNHPIGTIARLIQGENGIWYSAAGLQKWRATGRFYFVKDQLGHILASRSSRHTAMSNGWPVQFAGEVQFGGRGTSMAGQIKVWTNSSGHYKVPAAFRHQAGFPLNQFANYDTIFLMP